MPSFLVLPGAHVDEVLRCTCSVILTTSDRIPVSLAARQGRHCDDDDDDDDGDDDDDDDNGFDDETLVVTLTNLLMRISTITPTIRVNSNLPMLHMTMVMV